MDGRFTPPRMENPYLKHRRKRLRENNSTTEATAGGSNDSHPSTKDDIVNGNGMKSAATSGAITTPTSAFTSSIAGTGTASSASASALIISAADKAGMDGIDRTRIDAIILRESGDSEYMLQQRKRDAKVNRRIEAMKQRLRLARQQSNIGDGDDAVLLSSSSSPASYADIIDNQLAEYQRRQQSSRSTCLVLDMDMYYMACELLSRPDLIQKPACVGHGMILTSNYVARRYGVRSAMPGFIGDKLVEELSGGREKLIHVRSNFELYKAKANIVRDVLKEFDPNMKSYSLDEAFVDVGPYLALYLQHGGSGDWSHERIRDTLIRSQRPTVSNLKEDKKDVSAIGPSETTETIGSPEGICDEEGIESKKEQENDNDHEDGGKELQVSTSAVEILQTYSSMVCMEALERIVSGLRMRVQKATGGLTCSVGVGPNFSIAKIASDRNKPNGQLCVDPTQVLDFVRPLPVRKIPGIGRVTEKVLQHVCQVETVQDLYDKRYLVHWLFKPATAGFLLRASVGCSISGSSQSDFGAGEKGDKWMEASEASSSDHQKGISRERTFSPTSSWADLNMRLEDIARMVFEDMQRKSIMTRTITVKVKLKTFDVMSRAHSLNKGGYIQKAPELVEVASQVFSEIRSQFNKNKASKEEGENTKGREFSVRLLGIRCSNLIEESSFRSLQAGRLDKFLAPPSTKDGYAKESKEEMTETPNARAVVNHYTKKVSNSHADTASSLKKAPPLVSPAQASLAAHQTAASTLTSINDATKASQPEGNDCDDGQEEQELVSCPLCNRTFSSRDNTGLNAHLDACLSGSTVRRAIQEEDNRHHSATERNHQRLTDFFGRASSS